MMPRRALPSVAESLRERTDDMDDLLLEGWYFDRVGEETFHWAIGPSQ